MTRNDRHVRGTPDLRRSETNRDFPVLRRHHEPASAKVAQYRKARATPKFERTQLDFQKVEEPPASQIVPHKAAPATPSPPPASPTKSGPSNETIDDLIENLEFVEPRKKRARRTRIAAAPSPKPPPARLTAEFAPLLFEPSVHEPRSVPEPQATPESTVAVAGLPRRGSALVLAGSCLLVVLLLVTIWVQRLPHPSEAPIRANAPPARIEPVALPLAEPPAASVGSLVREPHVDTKPSPPLRRVLPRAASPKKDERTTGLDIDLPAPADVELLTGH